MEAQRVQRCSDLDVSMEVGIEKKAVCSCRPVSESQRRSRSSCANRGWMAISLVLVILLVVCASNTEAGSSNVIHRVKRQTPALNFNAFKGDVGMQKTDLIFILDRSASMNKQWFYQHIKKVTRALIERYVVVHPDYVRLAFITFAKDVTVDADYITKGYNLTKCQLMVSDEAIWHDIYFDTKTEDLVGTNIKEAFMKAQQLFNSSTNLRAKESKKVILLITDGAYQVQDDPYAEREELTKEGISIFAIGMGSWHVTGNVRQLASKPENYGDIIDWMEYLKGNSRSPGPEVDPLYVKTSHAHCGVCGGNGMCYCDALTSDYKCVCPKGQTLKNFTCTDCEYHKFKDQPGDFACTPCPSRSGTFNRGSESYQSCQCFNRTDPLCKLDQNPCDNPNACTGGNRKCIYTQDPSYACDCRPGYSFDPTSLTCILNTGECNSITQAPCVNGHCVQMANGFTCECDTAWEGRLCDQDINECRHPVCENNATCIDGNNQFSCRCPAGFKGYFCDEIVTTTTTTTTTTAPTTTTTPTTTTPTTTTPTTTPTTTRTTTTTTQPLTTTGASDQTMLIIIIAAAAGGALLLIIIIVIIVWCCCCKKRREPETKTATMSTSTGTQSSVRFAKNKPRSSIYKSISQRFSGIWKKKTIRGGMWSDDDQTKTGAPSAPAKRRPDLIANSLNFVDPKSHDLDEIVISNEEIAPPSGMEGWDSYLEDLQKAEVIKYGVIAHVDGEKVAKSSGFIYSAAEIDRAHELLLDVETDVQITMQGTLFNIVVNTGESAVGRTSEDKAEPEVILLSHTKKFIVALIAWETNSNDMDNLHKEVEYITDHISAEGY